MAPQLIETLLVSDSGNNLVDRLDKATYQVQSANEPGQAMEMLRDGQFDLILVEDELFSNDITRAIKEIKRRVPLVPVLVFSKKIDTEYETSLMEAGADDILTTKLSAAELQRRLRLVLRQRRQAQALVQRTQNLQSINLLARRMHSAVEPIELIQDTLETACSTFKLYGMAIVLADGETYQMYAGREGGVGKNGYFEDVLKLEPYDPFRRVIQSGIVQVLQNIVADPNYVPIPSFLSPESAIILPLTFQDYKIGALGVFGTSRNPLSHDDLLIYELFASQFTVALNNAQHYHNQRISAESSQHLLQGWHRFNNVYNENDIAESLQQFIEEIPNITRSLVWMYNSNPNAMESIVKASHEDLLNVFQQLESSGQLADLLQNLDQQGMQPIIIQQKAGQKDPLAPLFKALQGQEMMIVPIMDSARFIGGVVASVTNSTQYRSEDSIYLAAGIAHVAGLAMERATLIQETTQKTGRLETLIRGTSQGIFFLDDNGLIAFCNPQFTELTGVNPSEVLGQMPDVLFERIANQSDDPTITLTHLRDSVDLLLSTDPGLHEEYPIVEISLINPARDIDVEFMQIGDSESEFNSWAGMIRDNARSKQTFSGESLLLDMMSERIRVPYAQLRGIIYTLHEQHSRFTHRERAHFLKQLEESVDRMGHLWDNILETYNLQASGLSLNPEQVDLYEVVQRILDNRSFAEYRRQVQVEAPGNLPLIEIDELRVEQAITNVLYNAVHFSPRGTSIRIKMETQNDSVQLSVQDQGIGIPPEQLSRVFEPFFQATNNTAEEGVGLGLYLAHQVVTRHGGDMRVESEAGKGTSVIMAFPIVANTEVKVVALPMQQAVQRPVVSPPQPTERVIGGRRVSERPMQTIMIIEGRSKLIPRLNTMLVDEYEVIPYDSAEDAIRDLNTIRLDLIFLDTNLPDANGLDICERICKRTEVPIIMVTDEGSETEKVRAFMIGADDYIANPISDEELSARINVIFKRRRIPDRTREPLDLGNLYVDFARREVFLNNKPLELTRIEYDLLHTLAVHQGQVLTHKQLLEKVWGPEYQAETQYLWVNVSRLRKKLEPTPDTPRYIHTQPGVGYVFRPS